MVPFWGLFWARLCSIGEVWSSSTVVHPISRYYIYIFQVHSMYMPCIVHASACMFIHSYSMHLHLHACAYICMHIPCIRHAESMHTTCTSCVESIHVPFMFRAYSNHISCISNALAMRLKALVAHAAKKQAGLDMDSSPCNMSSLRQAGLDMDSSLLEQGWVLCIFQAYSMHIPSIIYAYSKHVLCIFQACSMHIPSIIYAYSKHNLSYSTHTLYIFHA